MILLQNMGLNKEKSIKGMSLREIKNLVADIGEDHYRANQIYKWIYKYGVFSFSEMTDLKKELREKLSNKYTLSTLKLKFEVKSNIDSTKKYLFELNDGNSIESVYMIEGKRITSCLSTMAGCPIGCPYCATGSMGLKRKLSAGEIIDQFLWINKNNSNKITNIVFMGMGEPFLNYDNTIKAAQIFSSDMGADISAKKIVISTCGIIPGIYGYTDEGHKFKLAISLNATSDVQRNQLIPINKKYPLQDLLKAARYYTRKSKRRITFEYTLITGINDTDEDAQRLISLLKDIPCKLNIIPYNENTFLDYRKPKEKEVERFVQKVYKAPFAVTVRRSKGADIASACGQLYSEENKQI